MKLMYKIFTAGLVGITTVVLILAATTTNSLFAIPLTTSQHGNQQGAANMMEQLFSGKNIKMGNMTLGFRPGVMVMPLLCMSVSGNMSGIPMLGSMMAPNLNQSGMIMGGQGNASVAGLGAMMKRSGMIPSVCVSMSDAMLFRSMMMHGGMTGANMTKGAASMGINSKGTAGNATAAANTTKAAGNATAAANTTKAAGNATAEANTTKAAGNATAAANTTKAAGNATAAANKGSANPITGLGQTIANGLKGLGNLITGNKK